MPKHRLFRTALLAASLLASSLQAMAESLPAYPFIHVTGSAYQQVMPDIAALDFEVVAVDADPAAARAVIEARMAEVQALVQQLSIDADDLTVREVRQNEAKGKQAADGAPLYELRCEVHINVRNMANWAALAGGLFGKPNLDSFASSFDLSNIDQVNDELLTQAIVDARRRAGVMATADGRRVGAMTAATPQGLKNLTTSMGLERGDFRQPRSTGSARPQDGNREQLLMVLPLKLSQSADVIFRLESAVKRTK